MKCDCANCKARAAFETEQRFSAIIENATLTNGSPVEWGIDYSTVDYVGNSQKMEEA